MVGVGLVRPGEAFEGWAVAAAASRYRSSCDPSTVKVVRCGEDFLQTIPSVATLCSRREVLLGKTGAQSGGGYVSRLRHAAHDGGGSAAFTGGQGAAGECILEFPGLPPDARRVGGMFAARYHPAGVLVPGRGGDALLHRGAHRQGRDVSRDVPARALAVAAPGRARRLSALHARRADLLHVRRYALADRARIPAAIPVGLASAALAVGDARCPAVRLLAGVGAVSGAATGILHRLPGALE